MHSRPTPEHLNARPHRDAADGPSRVSENTSERLDSSAAAWSGLLPADEAMQWDAAGLNFDEAVPWWLHGFTPRQAAHLRRRLAITAKRAAVTGATADAAAAWLASGLSREDITVSISTDCMTVAEGEALVKKMVSEPTLRGTMRLLSDFGHLERPLGHEHP